MVRVDARLEEDGWLSWLKVEGHAGFDEKGRDIVCAAVSVLVISLLNGLEKYTSVKPQETVEEGMVECRLPRPEREEDERTARVITSILMDSLREISKTYPENISISEIRK